MIYIQAKKYREKFILLDKTHDCRRQATHYIFYNTKPKNQ